MGIGKWALMGSIITNLAAIMAFGHMDPRTLAAAKPPHPAPPPSQGSCQEPCPNPTGRTLLLYTKVDGHAASRICKSLMQLDTEAPGTPITLCIGSPGGLQDSCQSIVNTMKMLKSRVHAVAMADVNSAATMVLAGATGKRIALKGVSLGIHVSLDWIKEGPREPYSVNAPYLTDTRTYYIRWMETFWREHARLPQDMFPMDAEKVYYLSGTQARTYGVIDTICTPEDLSIVLK